jgi:hypothetical protein
VEEAVGVEHVVLDGLQALVVRLKDDDAVLVVATLSGNGRWRQEEEALLHYVIVATSKWSVVTHTSLQW